MRNKTGGVREVRFILSGELFRSIEVQMLALHTSPLEGTLLDLDQVMESLLHRRFVMESLLHKSFSTAQTLPQPKSHTMLCLHSGIRIQNPHLNITNFQR